MAKKNNPYVGKPLDDVAKAQAENEVLYVGGSEAFFWIGTPEQYEEEIDDIDKFMTDYMKEQVAKKEETIKALKEQIKNLKQYIKEWQPLRDRTVKDCYPGIDKKNPGTKILIKGRTAGPRYWMKSEYDKERRNDGTLRKD